MSNALVKTEPIKMGKHPVYVRDVEQGSDTWYAMRKGIPTASMFSKIITGTTLKKSSSAAKYQRELCGELLGGKPEFQGNKWTERGNEIEAEAREDYEFLNGVDIEQVGFVYQDESKRVGCSPDGLVGVDGGVEFKCPSAAVHVEYLLKPKLIPCTYISQVRGSLYVTGRDWWDFVSYYPGVQRVLVRIYKSDTKQIEWVEKFEDYMGDFLRDLEVMKKRLGIA